MGAIGLGEPKTHEIWTYYPQNLGECLLEWHWHCWLKFLGCLNDTACTEQKTWCRKRWSLRASPFLSHPYTSSVTMTASILRLNFKQLSMKWSPSKKWISYSPPADLSSKKSSQLRTLHSSVQTFLIIWFSECCQLFEALHRQLSSTSSEHPGYQSLPHLETFSPWTL